MNNEHLTPNLYQKFGAEKTSYFYVAFFKKVIILTTV